MPEKRDNMGTGSYTPWSRIPSFKEMAIEAGIDHDRFINSVQHGCSIEEMAEQFGVSKETIKSLHDHFFKYGISSVIGGD